MKAASQRAQREADAWNAAHPVGTIVRFWTGLREGAPTGEGPTRAAAAVLSGHASVWIDGCCGGVNLSHVEVSTDDAETQYTTAVAALQAARERRDRHAREREEVLREAAKKHDDETRRLCSVVSVKQDLAIKAKARIEAAKKGSEP